MGRVLHGTSIKQAKKGLVDNYDMGICDLLDSPSECLQNTTSSKPEEVEVD